MAWPLAIFRNKKLQVHGSGVPEPYQHTLKRLLVRPTLQVWGIPLRKITLRKDRKDLGEQVFHTHTHTHAQTDAHTHTKKTTVKTRPADLRCLDVSPPLHLQPRGAVSSPFERAPGPAARLLATEMQGC